MSRVVVMGASDNPLRVSFQTVELLTHFGHEVFPVGIKKGQSGKIDILDIRGYPTISKVDTLTLYMNPVTQIPYYYYMLDLCPGRIIFNPGTENPALETMAAGRGILTCRDCTVLMLKSGRF
jgi:predicted CoA-binding protein